MAPAVDAAGFRELIEMVKFCEDLSQVSTAGPILNFIIGITYDKDDY